MNLNVKAAEIRGKLFDLVNEIKDLRLAVDKAGLIEESLDLDSLATALANEYLRLPDLFTDSLRDRQDQTYRVEV